MAELVQKTVGTLLEEIADRNSEREAVVYTDRNLRLTYRQFNEVCKETARAFMSLGIEKGDHLAIWATNTPEWLITQYATGKMGAVLVTVNTSYRAKELEYLLQQSDSKTLILMENVKDHSYIETLYEVIPELREARPGELVSDKLPYLKNVIVLGENRYPGTLSLIHI